MKIFRAGTQGRGDCLPWKTVGGFHASSTCFPNTGFDEFNDIAHHTNMKLNDIREAVSPLCRDFDVKRLDTFGSVARGTAGNRSDLDLLVEFNTPALHPARRFFGLLHKIEDTLGCEVDLLTASSLRNPYFKKRVMKERISIYEG